MVLPLRHRVIGLGLAAIAATRAERWLASVSGGLGAILTFHRVRPAEGDPFQPNALLEITPDFLDRLLGLVRRLGYDIVPLDCVPARLTRPGRPFVALTFDDGYRDNVEYAQPILERHGAPWTMFVVRDYAAGTGRLWWVELEEIVRRADRLTLETAAGTRDCPAGSAAEKHSAFAAVYAALRGGPEDRMRAILAAWCVDHGIDTDALARDLCLGWEEIRTLADAPGVTIGAHTLTHPMLAKHPPEVARAEIAEGGRILAERLGRPVRHISYPVGDPGSAGPREFALAAEARYETGVTTRPGLLFPAHAGHRHALPRVSVNGLHQSEAAIRALLSGVPFLAWNRGRRLNVG